MALVLIYPKACKTERSNADALALDNEATDMWYEGDLTTYIVQCKRWGRIQGADTEYMQATASKYGEWCQMLDFKLQAWHRAPDSSACLIKKQSSVSPPKKGLSNGPLALGVPNQPTLLLSCGLNLKYEGIVCTIRATLMRQLRIYPTQIPWNIKLQEAKKSHTPPERNTGSGVRKRKSRKIPCRSNQYLLSSPQFSDHDVRSITLSKMDDEQDN